MVFEAAKELSDIVWTWPCILRVRIHFFQLAYLWIRTSQENRWLRTIVIYLFIYFCIVSVFVVIVVVVSYWSCKLNILLSPVNFVWLINHIKKKKKKTADWLKSRAIIGSCWSILLLTENNFFVSDCLKSHGYISSQTASVDQIWKKFAILDSAFVWYEELWRSPLGLIGLGK